MAWNEPGGNKQDPWSGGGGDQGPPDLDEVVRKMQEKFGGLFGGGRGGKRGGGASSGSSGGAGSSIGIGVLILIAVAVWLFSGFYIVDPAERGVILRFGAYSETTGPGWHWHIPYPVERVEKVNVDQVRPMQHHAQMLTRDENLIQIALSVQYQVKDAKDYLFRVRDPDYTLKEVTESALREVVGSKTLDNIFSETGGREVLVDETEKNIQQLLDTYQAGLRVVKVNLESAQPPQEVQAAFDDAIKAREDEDRYKKKAEAYERDIIPKAEGDAQRLVQEAEAYKQQQIEKARGETSRFLQTLAEYRKAPEVTRKRLYLETMEEILASVSKVVVKIEQGNNIMYLPLDQFMKSQGAAGQTAPGRVFLNESPTSSTPVRPRKLTRPLREGR